VFQHCSGFAAAAFQAGAESSCRPYDGKENFSPQFVDVQPPPAAGTAEQCGPIALPRRPEQGPAPVGTKYVLNPYRSAALTKSPLHKATSEDLDKHFVNFNKHLGQKKFRPPVSLVFPSP
jgi:hypothetical protein